MIWKYNTPRKHAITQNTCFLTDLPGIKTEIFPKPDRGKSIAIGRIPNKLPILGDSDSQNFMDENDQLMCIFIFLKKKCFNFDYNLKNHYESKGG